MIKVPAGSWVRAIFPLTDCSLLLISSLGGKRVREFSDPIHEDFILIS